MIGTRPLRILVVDDDPAMVGAITALVGTEGHQVITAYDGLTAVKEIREFENSRGRSGTDRLTMIIVTTIREPSRILIAHYECGADAYIPKPFPRGPVLQPL